MDKNNVLLAILLGLMIGLGGFTFNYGEGLSYFSKDPEACTNCHIMEPQFDSWQKASHHVAATCVECHLPHDFIDKYISKAENGWNHSKAFTLQDFHEPISITWRNSRILQKNCIECHNRMVENVVHGSTSARDAVSCVHCHRNVGHGEPAGLGGPLRLSEK
jgi:cytochrome c nitrite reductase small subunit